MTDITNIAKKKYEENIRIQRAKFLLFISTKPFIRT